MTTWSLRAEIAFVCGLTASWAVLLLVPDGYAGTGWWALRGCAILLVVVLACVWSRRGRAQPVPPPQDAKPRSLRMEAATLLLLFGLAIVAYALPMKLRFWVGTDEFQAMLPTTFEHHWLEPPGGRPLLFSPVQAFAQYVAGGRIEPFLWLAVLLWFSNAVLLRAIVRRLTGSSLIATLAAILLIVHRGEPLRFKVLANTLYYLLPLFFFLGAVLLWLRSYERGSRGLLVLSCAFLAVGLLMTEGLFPLAAAVPVLAWKPARDWRRYGLWTGCWLGLVAVLAIKFARYLGGAGSASYQARQLGDALGDPASLGASLLSKLATIQHYAELANPYGDWALAWWAAALLAGASVVFVARRRTHRPHFRKIAVLFVAALGAWILGLLPFLHQHGLDRSQYLAAPAQAVVVGCILLALVRPLPRWTGSVALVLLVAAIAGIAARKSHRLQFHEYPVSFGKTVHVFEQIHSLSPRFAPDTVLLLRVEPGQLSPLSRFNYHVWSLSLAALGVNAVQVGVEDPLGHRPEETNDGVRIPASSVVGKHDIGFERLVGFRLSHDGTVRVMERHPSPAYDPLVRMRPGESTTLPFLRRPAWIPRRDGIVRADSGVLLGGGWSELDQKDAGRGRTAQSGAVLYVNAFQPRRIVVSASALSGSATCRLHLTGSSKASSPVLLRPDETAEMRIDLPGSPQRLLRLEIASEDGSAIWVAGIRAEAVVP